MPDPPFSELVPEATGQGPAFSPFPHQGSSSTGKALLAKVTERVAGSIVKKAWCTVSPAKAGSEPEGKPKEAEAELAGLNI